MSELSFRSAVRSDIAQVLANEVSAYPMPWGKQALIDSLQSQYQFFVAEQKGRVIGHIIYQDVLDESHLLNICLHPRYQGLGYGAALLEFWQQHCVTNKIQQLFLEVRHSNQTALKLYSRFGFQQLTVRKAYYPLPDNRREDGIIMRYQLTTD